MPDFPRAGLRRAASPKHQRPKRRQTKRNEVIVTGRVKPLYMVQLSVITRGEKNDP